jgi:hypothetical protein
MESVLAHSIFVSRTPLPQSPIRGRRSLAVGGGSLDRAERLLPKAQPNQAYRPDSSA